MTSSHLSQDQLNHPLSPIYPTIGPPSCPSTGSFVQMDCRSEGSLTETCAYRETGKWSADTGRCHRATIDMLPDVALLEIFDCYVNQARENDKGVDQKGWLKIQAWHALVHVCRQWRATVLGSPRRLDLQLLCVDRTPVKETLAVWPPLPIVMGQYIPPRQIDNIILALEHNDRICQIGLWVVTRSQYEEVLAAMQQPFPVLEDLSIYWGDRMKTGLLEDGPPLVVLESFLGGSAPRLQYLRLACVPFPGLPNLLLSATGLVSLDISQITHSGYISPEAMVRCLSTLTRLKVLCLGFKYPLSPPIWDTRRPHPPTRSVLPTLTYFWFEGVSEYLEDLLSRINAPLLNRLFIILFNQLIFDTPQLAQFIARTPSIQPPIESRIVFYDHFVEFISPLSFQVPTKFLLRINCRRLEWQLSSLTQVFSSSFPEGFLPKVEHLYICEVTHLRWQDDIEDSQWLEALHLFTAVKYLHLSRKFASRITPALQELAGEVLPSLQNLLLEDLHPSEPVQGAIEKFVAARQLASRPIAVSHRDGDPH